MATHYPPLSIIVAHSSVCKLVQLCYFSHILLRHLRQFEQGKFTRRTIPKINKGLFVLPNCPPLVASKETEQEVPRNIFQLFF